MKAIRCREWGAPDTLRFEEAESPKLQPHQVRIRVRAAGVNFADTLMVAGRYQVKPPFPFTPGLEAAGEVVEAGAAVGNLRVGERVIAVLRSGGGYAEEIVLDAAAVVPIPAAMDFVTAAAFPVAYGTSHFALTHRGRLQAGETLLVLGAAGGVGLTAVEIGKAMGARVIAAASTPEKLAVARAHGADETIDYAKEPLTERVMALTGGKGADVCFDPVGGSLFDPALSSLGWGGRILLIGFVGGVPQIPANRLLVKHRSAIGSSLRYFRWHAPDKLERSVEELFGWYREGKLKPCITHRLPLERSVEALHLLTDRRAHGKIVIELEAA